MLRRINLSAAMIVLVCFFLPWAQVSCGGARDNLSGFYLARHDQLSLWLVPLLMLAVLVMGLLRRRAETPLGLAIVSLVSGGVTAYLMNGQRARVEGASGILPAQLTGWFWLSFISSGLMVITAAAMLFKRPRDPAAN